MVSMYVTDADTCRVRLAAEIIQQCPQSHYTIPQLAEKVMLPEKKLKAIFKRVYGMGMYTYLKSLRLEKAKKMLQEGRPVAMVVKSVGYKSESSFCNAFGNVYGDTPGNWKKKHVKKT